MTPSEWYVSPRAASLSDACRSLAPVSTAAVLYCSLQNQQSDVLLMFVRHGAVPPASLIPCWMSSCMAEFVASGSVITSWIQHTAALQLGNYGCPSFLLPFHNPCIITTCSTTLHPICCCQCTPAYTLQRTVCPLPLGHGCVGSDSVANSIWCVAVCH